MPRFPGCTGSPALGPPCQLVFSWPAVSETTGLTEAIPTSEPATAQISYTIEASHLPTITGIGMGLYRLSPSMWCQVRNTSGAARTVSWRWELNGTSISTGSTSVSNNYYGMLSCTDHGTTLPMVGDVLTIKLWCATGIGVTLQSHTMAMNITRPWHSMGFGGWSPNYALCQVTMGNVAGRPSYGSSSVMAETPYSYLGGALLRNTTGSFTCIIRVDYSGNNYGLYIPHYGDNTYSTNYMSQASSSTGTQLGWSYRPTLINITWLAAKEF